MKEYMPLMMLDGSDFSGKSSCITSIGLHGQSPVIIHVPYPSASRLVLLQMLSAASACEPSAEAAHRTQAARPLKQHTVDGMLAVSGKLDQTSAADLFAKVHSASAYVLLQMWVHFSRSAGAGCSEAARTIEAARSWNQNDKGAL